jgi:hypothetical protein
MPDPTASAFDQPSSPLVTDVATPTSKDARRAMVSNRPFIIVWRVLIVIAAVTGIVLDSQSLSVFVTRLTFFTFQSNLMVIGCIGYAAWATWRKTPGPSPFLKGAVTLYITITCLVYNLILAKAPSTTPDLMVVPVIGGAAGSDLLHILTPFMVVLDWLLFDAHGPLRWRDALIWISYPLAYLAFALIRGLLVKGPFLYPYLHYPYSFLDVDHLGYGGVLKNALIYGVAFWLLGLVFVVIDRSFARFNRRGEVSL